MRKLLSFMLVLCLVIGIVPFAVSAEGHTVSDAAGLKQAIQTAVPGDTIILNENVSLSENLTIDKDLILNLNDHSIMFEKSGYRLVIAANVTIQQGTVKGSGTDAWNPACVIKDITTNTKITMDHVTVSSSGGIGVKLGKDYTFSNNNTNNNISLDATCCTFELLDSSIIHNQGLGGCRFKAAVM